MTRLLSQALGGNSLTAIICTTSPAAVNYYQTLSTLRFASRAKIVKTRPSVNEYALEQSAIEKYKNEIKKLQEELQIKNSKSDFELNFNKKSEAPIYNNEVFERIMKTNESLVNELENYKELYIIEKEKNNTIISEMNRLRLDVNKLAKEKDIKSEYSMNSNNNNLDNIQDNNYYDNVMSENEVGNDNEINEDNNKYNDEIIVNNNSQFRSSINNQRENIKANNNNIIKLNNKLEKLIGNSYNNQINNEDNNNDLKIQNIKSKTFSKSNNMFNQQNQHQNFKENEINNKFHDQNNFSLKQNDNNNNYSSNTETDEILRKIDLRVIFDDIKLTFSKNLHCNFEDNIKDLKSRYEVKLDCLDKNMEYFKSYIENYYRKQIHYTRQMDQKDFLKEKLPIMNITYQHNEKLTLLRGLYDQKLKELETVKIFK